VSRPQAYTAGNDERGGNSRSGLRVDLAASKNKKRTCLGILARMSEQSVTPEPPEQPPRKVAVTARLTAEGRWSEAAPHRDQFMREAKATGMSKASAQDWAYAMLDDLFPPLGSTGKTQNAWKNSENCDGSQGMHRGQGEVGDRPSYVDVTSENQARTREAGITGLSKIPADWPQLPPNASLSVEIQWALANRIRCVDESSDCVVVDLSQALTPAPSYAALGWLETSARAFAKFVDVAAKATSQAQDDQEIVRRERLAIGEIRSLLAEMQAEATPPSSLAE
jgi:hypothetical protein